MDNNIAKEMDLLLNNFWITKDENRDNYFLLKRNQNNIKAFVSKNLGGKVIVHDRFIKLEKIPATPKATMGIESFVSVLDYVILFLFLLYLEDKPRGEKFILSSITSSIKNMAITLELAHIPDWNNGFDRRSLLRVIDYLKNMNILILKDSDDKNFAETVEADSLYEVTGLSNYLIPAFDYNIYDCKRPTDFLNKEFGEQSLDRGDVRRYKVYRHLLYSPCVSRYDLTDSEYDYLRKMHYMIKKELLDNLDLDVEITKNLSLIFADEKTIQKEYFPNSKRISDIVLMLNRRIYDFAIKENIVFDKCETFVISKGNFKMILKDLRDSKKDYFSKEFLNLGLDKYVNEVVSYMKKFNFLSEVNNGYLIYPVIYRFLGKTSNIIKRDENEQLNLLGGDYNEV